MMEALDSTKTMNKKVHYACMLELAHLLVYTDTSIFSNDSIGEAKRQKAQQKVLNKTYILQIAVYLEHQVYRPTP